MLVHFSAVHEVLQLFYKCAVNVWTSKHRCAVNVCFSKHKCWAGEDYLFVACAVYSDFAVSCQTCLTLELGLLVV